MADEAKNPLSFDVWREGGVRFIAVDRVDGYVGIMDENGNNYGSWMSAANFRNANPEMRIPIGRAHIQVHQYGAYRPA